tara:strand:+ start:172 stop:291 length:120 start_codon:yes stop_codon:yes gene_type:complete
MQILFEITVRSFLALSVIGTLGLMVYAAAESVKEEELSE